VRILDAQNLIRNRDLVERLQRLSVRYVACEPSGPRMAAMQSIGKGPGRQPACNVSQVFPGGRMMSGAENQQTTQRKDNFLCNFNALQLHAQRSRMS
jgi:hypothetical protein